MEKRGKQAADQMITVDKATELINLHLPKLQNERIQLGIAAGRVLAEEIKADRDFPPFDRVTMDGIAICFSEYEKGNRRLKLAGEHFAGEKETKLSDPASAVEVMTGAVLPSGADTVIPYEEVKIQAGSVEIGGNPRIGQNIHRQGSDQKLGARLLSPGTLLGPAEVAILASVGCSQLLVYKLPKIAIVATGNELVNVEESPASFQIRSSNSHAMAAALSLWKAETEIFHLKDDKQELETKLNEIVSSFDVLLLSGGVSMGKADFLPEVLENIGIRRIFHKVAQKPGKPFWFGRGENCQVFAFPGNPVSSFMCFQKYFVPWLRKAAGLPPVQEFARLGENFKFPAPLTYFLQVRTEASASGEIWAYPRPGGGSGDLSNLLYSDAFLELPAGQSEFRSGEVYPLIRFK